MEIELVKSELDIQNGALVLLGDLHHGNQSPSDQFLEQKALNYLNKHKDYRIALNGDLIDNPQMSKLPTEKVTSVDEELAITSERLKPLYDQIDCVCWGNHEERTFREPFGKGVAQNTLYGHFSLAEEIKDVNPMLKYAPLMRGIHLQLHTPREVASVLIKHGCKAGVTRHFTEFEECLQIYQDVDYIMISHTHRPFIAPFCKIVSDGTVKQGWFIRGGAFTSWLPYQENRNMPPSTIGFVKVPVSNGRIQQPEIVVL